LEPDDAAVVLDLAEDGLDDGLALGVELAAAVAGQHAAHEVMEAADAPGSGFFAAVGVGRDDRLDALGGERVDRLGLPVAGVGDDDSGGCWTPAAASSRQAVSIIGCNSGVSMVSVLTSAATMTCEAQTTVWAL
jgi:hypothetical protein